MTTIELSDDEARLFLHFRHYYETMREAGVFNIQNGSCLILFNHKGDIQKIEVSRIFKRTSKKFDTKGREELLLR